MIAKFVPGIAGLVLALAAPPADAQDDAARTGRWADGTEFRFHRYVNFWRQSPPGTMLGETDDERAPGQVLPALLSTDGRPISAAERALFERKARVALDALLAQPSLRDPHGYAVRPRISIGRDRFGRLSATLSIFAPRIRLADPRTTNVAGRYFTPDEAPELRVRINHGQQWLNEIPVRRGRYNGALTGEAKGEPFFHVATNGRDPLVSTCCDYKGQPQADWNPNFYDPARPGSEIQYVSGMVIYDNHRRGALWDGTSPPDGPVPRLLAALFMTDWTDITRRMNAAR
ncbi:MULTISPECIES: hypothetical protein [unclassified Sphingomonas]|uniref:hypothetical protein n=1 Tax=unclassified Sphingomonas TaxID=196159 RepID=UPI0022B50047|nr:hypothetical protein [Sphingomonas sp. NIBR02145]WHU00911.1 hypothetical protein O3305_11835 [Sphingomonas sp. NIBR02145]